jgi:23S rRNA pseudouridine1911/1915/1917 synthase
MSRLRLDQIVATLHGLSRRKAREYVETGRVDVSGQTCREPGRRIPDESSVSLHLHRPAIRDVRSRLNVLHEEAELIVVEKPAGLLTLPTEAHEKDTLVGRLNTYLARRDKGRPYVGVVHRLDRDTSGAIVFARTRPMQRALQALFRRHDIDREYLAIVEGELRLDRGTISRDLVRDRGDRRRGVARKNEDGRPAVTHFEVRERLAGATLVSLRLETGRTHQIRIHLASIGHPVAGDSVYGLRGRRLAAPRQMLHAARLGLRVPGSGERVDAEIPPPEDFQRLRDRLRRPHSIPRGRTDSPPSSRGARSRVR